MKLDHYFAPYIKSKWIKDLNIKPETIKLPEGNIMGKQLDISLGSDSFWIQREKSNKSKNKQVGPHKTKKLCAPKKTINKMKRQPTNRKYLQIKLLIRG